jgi:acyl-CoA reductase-like NAD-dependent aldehyde dehydrogenase
MTDVKLEDAERVAVSLMEVVQRLHEAGYEWSAEQCEQAAALLRKIPELLEELGHEKSRLKRLASGEEP